MKNKLKLRRKSVRNNSMAQWTKKSSAESAKGQMSALHLKQVRLTLQTMKLAMYLDIAHLMNFLLSTHQILKDFHHLAN
jgi:hypothetical protein